MAWKTVGRMIALLSAGTLACGGIVMAGEDKPKEPKSAVDQVGESVSKLADKIGKKVTGVVKQVEESKTPKKVGDELKRSAEVLGKKAEQAGKRLKESFTSE